MIKGLLTLLMVAGIAAAVWTLPPRERHHQSGTGVFYTTDYLTLHLPGGVVGFPPGSLLRACFTIHVPDKEVVTDGRYTLAVDPLALTHDMEYAEDLAEADGESQVRTLAGIAQRKAHMEASQRAAYLVAARDIDGANAIMKADSTVGNYDTRLNRPTTPAGVAGSYDGGASYYSASGGSSESVVNNVSVVNNFSGGSSRAAATTATLLPGKIARGKSRPDSLSTLPMTPTSQ